MNKYDGAFTVKDLKKAIEDLPDDMLVVLQSDAEGNSYSIAAGVDAENIGVIGDCWYDLSQKYRQLTPEMCKNGYTEEDVDSTATPCIILWPT